MQDHAKGMYLLLNHWSEFIDYNYDFLVWPALIKLQYFQSISIILFTFVAHVFFTFVLPFLGLMRLDVLLTVLIRAMENTTGHTEYV